MQIVLSLCLIALPAMLVLLVHHLFRKEPSQARRIIWGFVAALWMISVAAWISYARQTNDVDLIVHGLLGWATLIAAVLSTLTAVLIQWRS